MGTEPRLRIMQLLLSAHPDGLVVGEIGNKLEIPSSTLSHHLEKLKNEDLVKVRREGTFLWYSANTDALKELLGFLYAECCTRLRPLSRRRSSPSTRKEGLSHEHTECEGSCPGEVWTSRPARHIGRWQLLRRRPCFRT